MGTFRVSPDVGFCAEPNNAYLLTADDEDDAKLQAHWNHFYNHGTLVPVTVNRIE